MQLLLSLEAFNWARRNTYKYCAVPCSLVLAFCDIILRIRKIIIEIMSFVAVGTWQRFKWQASAPATI
ncbi:hypothetical protein CY34DRAFT_459433 [Suillus luteus UH-Slu-Lm8-n1]|uniref:Uncharacterized protein n=1 Tax=Suillus luteus UH-Slu-Lm8-n1 TaxID=930992 RepID=A0A0D0BJN8_9AGAM|nr:hypothetical protein CY34DRAFT_459433 [Suillus luteus UH-Slu-Lm8-n1]